MRPFPLRQRAATIAVALVLLAACGGGSDEQAAEPPCEPSGDQLAISADNLKFDRPCLAAPADRSFTIVFTNEESLPHNVEILKEQDGSSDQVFLGEIFSGKRTVTYQVPALGRGDYSFRCTVHPQMRGTVLVGGGEPPPAPPQS